MICASCGHDLTGSLASEASSCPTCDHSLLLAERYALDEVLGEARAGRTYAARDMAEGAKPVVVKELLLRRTESMKEVELFQREAQILERLDHPGLPAYHEHFEVVRGKEIGLYLVEELIGGETLREQMEGHRFTEAEVTAFLVEGLELLGYLCGVDPPVVHRDIKPSNLMRRASDGRLVLVDFGAARVVAETLHRSGSTFTGTFGFMAPEQLYGGASPASDVYGLGATAIAMLSRREPHELLDEDGRLTWVEDAGISPRLSGVLLAMTDPDPEARPTDLRHLREVLTGESSALETRTRGANAIAQRSRKSADVPMRHVVGRMARVSPEGALGAVVVGAAAVGLVLLAIFGANVACLIPSVLILGGILYGTLGGALPAAATSIRQMHALRSGVRTWAVVREREATEDIRRQRFVLIYDFVVDGETYSGRDEVDQARFFALEPGDEVEICYRPERPQHNAVPPVVET